MKQITKNGADSHAAAASTTEPGRNASNASKIIKKKLYYILQNMLEILNKRFYFFEIINEFLNPVFRAKYVKTTQNGVFT